MAAPAPNQHPDMTFQYRLAPMTSLGIMLSLGVFAFAILHFALTYTDRIDPPFMFPLSGAASRFVIRLGSVPFLVGMGICFWAIRLGLDPDRQVILSSHDLIAPKSLLSKTTLALPCREIGPLGATDYRGTVILKIPHPQHELTLTSRGFSDASTFTKFVNVLETRLAEHRKDP